MNLITNFAGGGGYRTLVLALLALAALLAASALTLAPAKAQTPGPPASIEISEPLGSLSLGSQFQLTATVTDASGNPVSDGTAVTWSNASSGSEVVLVRFRRQPPQPLAKPTACTLSLAEERL